MKNLELRYESALEHGESMISRDPSVKNDSLVRRALLDFLCRFGVSTEGAEHITHDPAIYAIIDHPTFMDGPRAYNELTHFENQLPLLGVTWIDNFTHPLAGKILRKDGNTFPIQRPNAVERYEKKGIFSLSQSPELIQRGEDLNAKTAEFFQRMLTERKASFFLWFIPKPMFMMYSFLLQKEFSMKLLLP